MLYCTSSWQHRCGAEEARGAHNSEVIRSKRISGIISLRPFKEAGRQGLVTLNKHPCYRCGAEASAQGS